MRDKTLLRQLQALPLDAKILMSQQRIREWYNYWHGKVMISFSGGKDSTVLAHLVHGEYPDVPMVFANTGLEYPEIQKFAREMGAEFVRPKMSFSEVISTHGYPIISKETAEAICAARKIVDHSGHTSVVNKSESGSDEAVERARPGWKWAAQKREELHGERKSSTPPQEKLQNESGSNMLGESFEEHSGRDGSLRERHDWKNWRRKALTGVGEFGEGSQFNKKKWLPLCQETQFLISHYCCNVMKKNVMHKYQKQTGRLPYLGTMAEESRLREQKWIQHGCNAFEGGRQISAPMSFWTEQDVLHYIKREGLQIASVYGDIVEVDDNGYEYFDNLLGEQCNLKCTGCERTGCIFCGFGCHLEKGESRFQALARTHSRQYEYCMGGGQWVDNPRYDPAAHKFDGDWENWNPKKIWVPSKEGLGMKKVFDDVNAIYGKDFIRY